MGTKYLLYGNGIQKIPKLMHGMFNPFRAAPQTLWGLERVEVCDPKSQLQPSSLISLLLLLIRAKVCGHHGSL